MSMPKKERALLASLAAVAAIGAMLLADPNARADTGAPDDAHVFCHALDVDASPRGFINALTLVYGARTDVRAVARDADAALDQVCPRHWPDFEATYAYLHAPKVER